MFEKSLQDLVRGIRAHRKSPEDERQYIDKCLREIEVELKRTDMDIKSQAVLKLAYLYMLGHDFQSARFHVVEVMSSPRYKYKRIGYLAAITFFSPDESDMLTLATNQLRKDLASNDVADIGLALAGVSHFTSLDIARVIAPDIMRLLNHPRSLIRKKACLASFALISRCPELKQALIPSLKQKLDDNDTSVVSTAVTMFAELVAQEPEEYVTLAPQLFRHLTSTTNNWMLIKIIKIFSYLCREEPRLIKKLLPPITTLLQSTTAMSLINECIYTLTSGGMLQSTSAETLELVTICVDKLRLFIQENDQNLRYIGLVALREMALIHPRPVSRLRNFIILCLDDINIAIRLRALHLAMDMADSKLRDVVDKLLHQLATDKLITTNIYYRTSVALKILESCSADTYAHIHDFEWYYDVLVALADMPYIEASTQCSEQLIDVAVRVRNIREHIVSRLVEFVKYKSEKKPDENGQALATAIWIIGEFNRFCPEPFDLASLLLTSVNIHAYGEQVHMAIMQTCMKLVIATSHQTVTKGLKPFPVQQVCDFQEKVRPFLESDHFEVLERANNFYGLLCLIEAKASDERQSALLDTIELAQTLFSDELNPVASSAQESVPLPDGLDLHTPINPDWDKTNARPSNNPWNFNVYFDANAAPSSVIPENEEDRQRRMMARAELLKSDPFYLPNKEEDMSNLGKISQVTGPLVQLSLDPTPVEPVKVERRKKKREKKVYEVVKDAEMPGSVSVNVETVIVDPSKKRRSKKGRSRTKDRRGP